MHKIFFAVLRKACKELEEGQTKLYDEHRATNYGGKMMIVRNEEFSDNRVHMVIYPHLTKGHFSVFYDVIKSFGNYPYRLNPLAQKSKNEWKGPKPGGGRYSAFNFKGALGYASVSRKTGRRFRMNAVQGFFKIGRKAGQVDRKIANQYAKWRRHLLTEAIFLVQAREAVLEIPLNLHLFNSDVFEKEVESVCEATGSRIKRTKLALVITPPKTK